MKDKHKLLLNLALILALAAGVWTVPPPAVAATQIDLTGPAGSEEFASEITVLPNGNIVVVDKYFDASGGITDAGAVYLYNGATGALISTLTGSTNSDQVGRDGVTVLTNGNYVVVSAYWDNGGVSNAGAVTWCSGTTGCSGTVSAANSLVGSSAGDQVGGGGVTALTNGNYVVNSYFWDNGAVSDVGAVTWCSGTIGCTGAVSTANSLVGPSADDMVGDSVTALTNGNYVVSSAAWDNGGVSNVGAVTWGSGTTGITGTVSAANSLAGSSDGDMVAIGGVTALDNGNYVVVSTYWDNGGVSNAGAVTWGSGTTGITGTMSAANSLVGSSTSDQVGYSGVTALDNGNYVVRSHRWDNGGVSDAGAVTWGSGTTGITGTVSAANSLVGSSTSDQVGEYDVTVLDNGNYVVRSHRWDNGGVSDAGAVTWGNGTTGITGTVSAANSLVGSSADDRVGYDGVTALTNGNYVVASAYWDDSAVSDAGAATWCSGAIGCTGAVSTTNSLVGSSTDDRVGEYGVIALTNGNYVVRSHRWDNGGVSNAGAATWGSGTTGITGTVSAANSLVGSSTDDYVSSDNVEALTNGNYVVSSYLWDNGGVSNAGAATWCNGTTGITGTVSAANSLVGSSNGDWVGYDGVTALANGNYVVASASWDDSGVSNAGAVTWGSGTTGIIGTVSAANSLVGSSVNDRVGSGGYGIKALDNGNYGVASDDWGSGAVTLGEGNACATGPTVGTISAANSVLGSSSLENMRFAYDTTNHQLVVSRPADNIVSLFRADDRDGDCVLDTIEDSAPNSGDGNNDGTLDRQQAYVTSLPSAVGGNYLTLVAPPTQHITEVQTQTPGAEETSFPIGFVAFKLFSMPTPPAAVTVSLLMRDTVTFSQYWRSGPEPGSLTTHWYRFDPPSGSPATGATIVSSTQVDLTFVDGERGDDDLAVNTILLDEGGPTTGIPTTIATLVFLPLVLN